MDILEFFLHSIHVLNRVRIIKFFFLLLDLPIKFDEVEFSGQRFKFRLVVSCGELCLDLIKKWTDDGLDKGSCEFDRIRLLDNDGEDDILMHLIKDTEVRIVNMSQH